MTEGPQDIHLIPQLNGGKNGGFFQVLIGAVLVAASFAATALGLPTIGGILLKVGITLMIGGVLQLLQQPPRENDSNSKKNHYLGSPQNTTQIGTTIPILCGRRKVGGQFLSFQIAPVEVA
jgi:predicted phage tail protein